jgi:hypothetical protein
MDINAPDHGSAALPPGDAFDAASRPKCDANRTYFGVEQRTDVTLNHPAAVPAKT